MEEQKTNKKRRNYIWGVWLFFGLLVIGLLASGFEIYEIGTPCGYNQVARVNLTGYWGCYNLSELNISSGSGNTTEQMQTAVNVSEYYQIKTEWANIQNKPTISNVTTTTCGGTDKVSAINSASGVVTCSADQSGGTTESEPELYQVLYDEFTYWTTARTNGIGVCAALSSGTAAAVTDIYPGVVRFSDSTTINGGYICRSDSTSMYFLGNETLTIRAKTGASRTTNKEHFGFSDSTTAALGTDYCAFNATDLIISAGCRNNAGPTNSATQFLRSANTWYTYVIQTAPGGSYVYFSIWDATKSIMVWSANISGNIPNTVARAFGVTLIAWETTTSAAAIIVNYDYVKLEDTTWI